MVIHFTQQQIEQIYQHGCISYPFECCGIILGSIEYETSEPEKTVVELIPTENAWNDDSAVIFGESGENSLRRRYAIAPSVMLNAQKTARDRCLDIIGIYHSHPDCPAIPSEFDRCYAWCEYSYVIVSIQNSDVNLHHESTSSVFTSGVFPNTTNIHIYSWCLDENRQFQPERIVVS